MKKLTIGLIFGMHMLLSACATPTKMAYSDSTKTVVSPSNAVFLMTATLKNTYHPSHQPKILVVNVEKVGATDRSQRFNFVVDKQAKYIENSDAGEGNTYLLRMELPPGDYKIYGFNCLSSGFPRGMFYAPLHDSLTVSSPGIFYLGHVDATVRERTGNEFKAGPIFPLIDQAIAGASGGTFDVDVSDRWDTDEPIFRARLAKLGNSPVQKELLPPFDRAKAQDWWEKH